ncbi:methyl-accepting chemotaxis protein [Sorangium sp. So ce185]|uniref:hypothetical protein n=1 Tax=Sorangium sp. So ce185 TaxID=3133287 RepID=UPI003F622392
MLRLDELEQRFRDMLQRGAVEVVLEKLELPELPDRLWPTAGLKLLQATIDRTGPSLVVAGSGTIELLGRARTTLTFREQSGSVSMDVELDLDSPAILDRLLAALVDGLDYAVIGALKELTARGVSWRTLPTGGLQVTLSLSGSARFDLGVARATLSLARAAFVVGGPTPVRLDGELSLLGVTVPASVTLDDKLQVSAELPDMDLRRLAEALSLPLPPLPPLSLLQAPLRGARLYVRGDEVRLSAAVDASKLGPARAVIARSSGSWGLVLGLHPPRDFRFADLSAALTPLDKARELLRLDDPALTVSTVRSSAFPYVDSSGEWTTVSVQVGGVLRGELVLNGLGLELIAAILGTDRLPLQMPLGPDGSEVRLTASIAKRVNLIPECVTIETFRVVLSPDPLLVTAAGEVKIDLFGQQLPRFVLGASLTAAGASLFFTAAEPWKLPLGLPLVIEELGFQISGPDLAYGVFGKIAVQGRAMSVAAKFVGQAPTLIAGKLEGEMPLGGVLEDLIQVNPLPDFVQPRIRDFDTYLVVHPAGTTVGERSYPFGLSLSGTLLMLGLALRANVHVSRTRVIAEGSLDRPIRLDPVLRVTGAGSNATPVLRIDTGSDPVARMSARVECLGLAQEVDAVLGTHGFTFKLDQKVGAVHASLRATLGNGRLKANGVARFGIRESFGPIRLFDGGPNLGTIRVDTGIEAIVDLSIAEGAALTANVSARFTFLGIQISVPEFAVDVASIERIPEAVIRAIRANLLAIFDDVFGDADRWLAAVAKKLIDGVEDVAKVLSKHFNKNSAEVARALRRVLNETVEQTAQALKRLGETPERIAQILSDIGESAEQIGKALKALGQPPEVIGKVLKQLGKEVAEVGKILTGIGFPKNMVDAALKMTFPGLSLGSGVKLPFIKVRHLKVF